MATEVRAGAGWVKSQGRHPALPPRWQYPEPARTASQGCVGVYGNNQGVGMASQSGTSVRGRSQLSGLAIWTVKQQPLSLNIWGGYLPGVREQVHSGATHVSSYV